MRHRMTPSISRPCRPSSDTPVELTTDTYTYTSVLTDLLAYAAEATAKLVLPSAARNPAHPAPPKRSPGKIRWAARGRVRGTSRDQAFRSSQRAEAGPPRHVPPTSYKDQGRIADKLYALVMPGAPRRT